MGQSRYGRWYLVSEKIADEDLLRWSSYLHKDGELRLNTVLYSVSQSSWEMASVDM